MGEGDGEAGQDLGERESVCGGGYPADGVAEGGREEEGGVREVVGHGQGGGEPARLDQVLPHKRIIIYKMILYCYMRLCACASKPARLD